MRLRNTETVIRPVLIYLATLVLLSAASYLPQFRVWGVGLWAFLPPAARFGLIAVGIAPIVWLWLRPMFVEREEKPDGPSYLLPAGLLTALWAALFFLFPAKTFFLGDGFQNLATMAAGHAIVKFSSLGEGAIRNGLARLLDVTDQTGALQVYRIIAGICGLGFVATAAAAAGRLFSNNLDRLLFTAGLATGGYALLFFGYVEQYSLFALAVGLFTLVGLLIAQGRASRWWIMLLLPVAVLMHVFGALLAPAAVYLLLADTRIGRRLKQFRPGIRALLATAGVLVAVVAGVTAFRRSLFIQYALIPLVDSIYAYDHYTLLAPAHLLDFVNLLLLLLPATGLLLFLVYRPEIRALFRSRPAVFLLVLTIATFGGLFWVDPKLGLPRDWDLFSFAGIPLVALFYLLALTPSGLSRPVGRTVAVLGITLGCLSLGSRVAILQIPEAGIAQHKAYLTLDRERGLRAYSLIRTYYLDQGDSTAAAQVSADWHRLYPERAVFIKGLSFRQAGQWTEAAREFRLATRMNSTYSDPWSHLGEFYMNTGHPDSAVACFRRTLRLNPYEASAWNNLGGTYLRAGQYAEAEASLTEAHSLMGDNPANLYNLATLYRLTGRMDRYADNLIRAARFADAPPGLHKELANYYLTTGDINKAAEQYRAGLSKGLDTAFVRVVLDRVPALRRLVPLK